jgi:CDP-diacylglycerol--glycerol-3-phosphate 3-phosphatidyltransferase
MKNGFINNFANRITIFRILAVPFFIAVLLYYSPQREYLRSVALGIFLFAVISDLIDGYIARTQHQRTQAGAILDPLADKFLLISAFICLYKVGEFLPATRFPLWLVVTVISRDVILLIGALLIFMVHGQLSGEATKWGKLSTFFQVVAVLGMLLQWPIINVSWYVAVLFAVVSAVDYIWYGIKVLNLRRGQVPGVIN